MPGQRKTRLLVVDDSATARRMVSTCLRAEPDIEVIGEAADAFTANDLVERYHPDLITLDIEMPDMDGLSFLQHLMARRPIPVIVISSHTPPGSILGLKALEAGAIDVMAKPLTSRSVGDLGRALKQRIRQLRAYPIRLRSRPVRGRSVPAPRFEITRPANGLIAVGTSVGGPRALELLLMQWPLETPPIAIVQHMPAPFIPVFAQRLDKTCALRVGVARDGEELACGAAYLAPGDTHLSVEQWGDRLRARLHRGAPVNYQRPSVDVLFQSAARLRHVSVVAALLTGMGSDGADGMVALRRSGHHTIAEDPQSCVVFGMPREAIARGGASQVLMLEHMPAAILSRFQPHAPLP